MIWARGCETNIGSIQVGERRPNSDSSIGKVLKRGIQMSNNLLNGGLSFGRVDVKPTSGLFRLGRGGPILTVPLERF
jgi:hypothetical protein